MKSPSTSLEAALADAEVFDDGDWVESEDQDPDGDVRLIQLADVGDGTYVNRSARFLTSSKAAKLRCTFLKPGDILVARMPDPLGRSCIFPGDAKSAVTVVDVCIIRPNPDQQDARWLMHCLNAPQYRNQIARFATGTTRSRISRGNLKRIEILLLPLAEQRRIAEVLDRAEALRAKRRAAVAQLDKLSQAIFLDVFGDPVTNPKAWPRRPIGEIARVITGNTPPRANPGYYGTAIEWIKSDNINTPHYYLTKADEGLSQSGKGVARTVPAGSILVTCIAGSPDCIGNAAMTDREVAFNQQINALVPLDGDAHFLYAQIIVGKRLIQEASTEGMKGIVSKSRLERVSLTFPALDLQREFARRVVAVEKLKTTHRASLVEMDALFASLQHRAFRGEL